MSSLARGELYTALSLSALACLLGAYIWLFEISHPKGGEKALSPFRRVPLSVREVYPEALEIRSSQGRLRIWKKDSLWHVQNLQTNEVDLADSTLVSELLRSLENIPFDGVEKASPEKLSRLGFAPPLLEITLHYGLEKETFSFGKQLPQQKLVFLKFQDQIYLVPLHFRAIWDRSFATLRERRILPFSFYDLDCWIFQFPQTVWSLNKKEGQWYLWKYPLSPVLLPQTPKLEKELFFHTPLFQLLYFHQKPLSSVALGNLASYFVTSSLFWKIPLSQSKVRHLFQILSHSKILAFHPAKLEVLDELALELRAPDGRILCFQGGELKQRILFWQKNTKVFALLQSDRRQVVVELARTYQSLWQGQLWDFLIDTRLIPWSSKEIREIRWHSPRNRSWRIFQREHVWQMSPPFVDVVSPQKLHQWKKWFASLRARPWKSQPFSWSELPQTHQTPQWMWKVEASWQTGSLQGVLELRHKNTSETEELYILSPRQWLLPHRRLIFLLPVSEESSFQMLTDFPALTLRPSLLFPQKDLIQQVEVQLPQNSWSFQRQNGVFGSSAEHQWVEKLLHLPVTVVLNKNSKRELKKWGKLRLIISPKVVFSYNIIFHERGVALEWPKGQYCLTNPLLKQHIKELKLLKSTHRSQ